MRWLTTPLHNDADVVAASSRLRAWADALGLEPVTRARVVTLGVELARAAASSGHGSIEFGWSVESGRPWCAIEAPTRALDRALTEVGEAGLHLDDLDVTRAEDQDRARVRVDARSVASRENVERAVADAADASAVDVLRAQNLELARMLGTLRDREADLVRALDDARRSANEAAAHALHLEEASKKKDELLAIASHDIRSPLGAARGAIDLLEPTLASATDDQRDLLRVARRGCDAAVHLVGNLMSTAMVELLDLSDADGDETTTFDLASTTREVLELATVPARQKGVAIRAEVPASIALVRGDPTWARQIVANLVNNALKYAPRNGGHVEVRVEERGREVHLVIDDDGVGIPAEQRARVFDKLARLRPRGTAGERGTGIGLYVTKKLVERLGGAIAVHPREPSGTRFEVRLPAASAERRAAEVIERAAP